MLNLLLTVGTVGATEPQHGSAAVIEQQLQRRVSYAVEQTPQEQVRHWLQNYYVDAVPDQVLNAESIDEMINALNDPYTAFMTVEQYSSFTNPEVVGIGVYIESVAEGILIKSLIVGSPAEQAGLQSGDIIGWVKENQEGEWVSLAGLEAQEGSSLIRGPVGSQVDLKIIRQGQLLYFTLTREVLGPPPVSARLYDPATAYIDLNTFFDGENQPPVAAQFAEAVQDMESRGAQGYILDLRDNGGGYVHNALDISGFFIGDQRAMQVKPRVTSETAVKHDLLITKPLVVLINQNTASASEIMSGALKDYNCAIFLGQRTYGKGCMQSVFPIYEQGDVYGYLTATTARYFTPLGHPVDQVGIEPHIIIYQPDPLPAARLLLSAIVPAENDGDSNVVKFINEEQEYRIDISQAQQPEYWPVYNEMIENAGSLELMLPDGAGWALADPAQVQAKWPFYYPGCYQFPSISKRIGEPITIKFSHAIDPASVQNRVIELFEKESGTSIDLAFDLKTTKELQVTPLGPLQPEQEYWLVIHPGSRGVCSHDMQLTLSTGYIVYVTYHE